jgi:tetratricopeptide (TPR) repeat protein
MLNASHAPVRSARWLLTALLLLGFILGCGKKEPTAEETLAQAETLRAQGRVNETIALLENYERAHPGNFAVIEALAFAYIEAGDLEVAALYFTRAAQIDQRQAEYLLMAAEAWRTAGDPGTAIASYQDFLLLRPEAHEARLALAELYREQGQIDAARNTLIQVNAAAPSGAVQVRIGRLFLEGNNLAQAQQWFDSAARRGDEARPEALLGLIEVAIRANRYGDAEQLVTVLDREFPGRLEGSRPHADLRSQLNAWRQRQEAAEVAAAQIATPPAGPAAPAPSAGSPPARTAASFPPPTESASASPPAAPDGPAGEVDDAEAPPQPDKEEVVAAAERSLDSTSEQSAGPDRAGVPSGPRSLFPSRDPSGQLPQPAAQGYAGLLATARAEMAAGRYAEAVRNYQRALARSSADPEVWSELSEAQYRHGDVQIAPSSASEAVRRAPQEARFRLQYLRALQGSAAPTRMLEEMEDARRDFPRDPDFALVLARAHRDLGSLRFAHRYYEEFLRLASPAHPERAAAESEMRGL